MEKTENSTPYSPRYGEAETGGTGRLKIFFGYAAGVGKTYAMLEAAHQAQKEGVDVVVGYVEPHARPDTLALLEGLEVLSCREVDYRGIRLREFDLDGALARRPQLILVDELAHSNAPGCRHTKRYQDIQELLRAYLEDAGYQTAVAGDGVAALALFGGQTFDLVLLDLMLPKIDGFGVCELIRQQSQVPILMLTALDGEESQLRGFGMDIDDYVTKPFSMPVLLEKIRVILRRRGNTSEDNRLRYRDLTLDLDTREALLDGRLLDLTAREFELLHTFLAAPGRVFTREMLLAKLWGYDFYGDERVVDSHIKNLRHKLGRDYIDTVRGVGYRAAKEDR